MIMLTTATMLQWFYTVHVTMAVLFIAFACMHWARCWMMIFPGGQTRHTTTAETTCSSQSPQSDRPRLRSPSFWPICSCSDRAWLPSRYLRMFERSAHLLQA